MRCYSLQSGSRRHGSHSAATTEQCGAGGKEIEREGLSIGQ